MFDRFKNLDKKQKLELYKVLGYSICALIGGAGSAKQIADAMGHDLETHLKSYSRFNTKDLESAFDYVAQNLEKKVEKISNL